MSTAPDLGKFKQVPISFCLLQNYSGKLEKFRGRRRETLNITPLHWRTRRHNRRPQKTAPKLYEETSAFEVGSIELPSDGLYFNSI